MISSVMVLVLNWLMLYVMIMNSVMMINIMMINRLMLLNLSINFMMGLLNIVWNLLLLRLLLFTTSNRLFRMLFINVKAFKFLNWVINLLVSCQMSLGWLLDVMRDLWLFYYLICVLDIQIILMIMWLFLSLRLMLLLRINIIADMFCMLNSNFIRNMLYCGWLITSNSTKQRWTRLHNSIIALLNINCRHLVHHNSLI